MSSKLGVLPRHTILRLLVTFLAFMKSNYEAQDCHVDPGNYFGFDSILFLIKLREVVSIYYLSSIVFSFLFVSMLLSQILRDILFFIHDEAWFCLQVMFVFLPSSQYIFETISTERSPRNQPLQPIFQFMCSKPTLKYFGITNPENYHKKDSRS